MYHKIQKGMALFAKWQLIICTRFGNATTSICMHVKLEGNKTKQNCKVLFQSPISQHFEK